MKSMTRVTGERQGLLATRCIDGQWSPLARGGGGAHPRNHEGFGTRKNGWPLSPREANKTAAPAPPPGAPARSPAKALACIGGGEGREPAHETSGPRA